MFKKKKNVFQHSSLDRAFPDIAPVKNSIPDWYKQGTRFMSGSKPTNRLPFEAQFKLCTAFADSFVVGYTIPLAIDIAVEQTPGGPAITWTNPSLRIVELRPSESNKELPTPLGCSPLHFVWNTQHVLKIPKGYSALLTHPLNRFDLPFITLSGIVDGEIALHNGNVPVYFSNTFEGIIEAGTPILQVILFKTENWTNERNENLIQEAELNHKKSMNKSFGYYKKTFWKKKNYD